MLLLLNTEGGIDMEAMKIKFGGQTNQIEANTLINSLIHFTNIVQDVNTALSSDLHVDKKLEIKINATQPGSFIMDFVLAASDAIADGAKIVFSKETISYAANLIQTLGGVYNVAKFLIGKNPKSIETGNHLITITNNNGEVNNFDFRGANIYLQNPSIQKAISQQFETLGNDPNVSDFELLNKDNQPIFEADKNQMLQLSTNEEDVTETSQIKPVKATLRIISLSWELRKKWEFYYEGNRISAKIKDETFAELIKKGETFAMGDALEVEMEIRQELDEAVGVYINSSYVVAKIIKHLKRSEQTNLEFPNGEKAE